MSDKNPRMQLAAYKNWCARKLEDLKNFEKKYKGGFPPPRSADSLRGWSKIWKYSLPTYE